VYKLNFKKNSNRYNKQQLINNIQTVWDHHGRQPTTNDMAVFPSKIHYGTYFNHFGSWKKALEAFVSFKNGGKIPAEPSLDLRAKRKSISTKLRLEVMNRDKFKCKLCGKSPANDVGIQLEIDHAVSLFNGGSNEIENLQTLCNLCNNGKKNKS
jgi:hypothetical protein